MPSPQPLTTEADGDERDRISILALVSARRCEIVIDVMPLPSQAISQRLHPEHRHRVVVGTANVIVLTISFAAWYSRRSTSTETAEVHSSSTPYLGLL